MDKIIAAKSDTDDSSPVFRGKRLKLLRNLANLTREELCEDGTINKSTLSGWENGRFGGLTRDGAQKIILKINQLNKQVFCSLDWLMDGSGPQPSVNPIPSFDNSRQQLDENLKIAYEVAFFKSNNPAAIELNIIDETMMPNYNVGDFVAGNKKTGSQIKKVVGLDCIVSTEKNELLLRNIKNGTKSEHYTLVCTNPCVHGIPSVMIDVKIQFAAPVIWHRKKDIS